MISDYLEKYPEYGPKAYQCKVCGKVSSDKSSASKNVENIHKPGVFTYTYKHCGNTFSSRTTRMQIFQEHIETVIKYLELIK